MKKIMKLFVYVAAAAMTLASCQKNEIDGPVKKDVHFTINAGIETKTVISDNGNGTYTPSWKNGDQIGIFFNEQLVKDAPLGATFSNTNPDGEVASFDGTASVTGNGTFYAFYPATAFNKVYDGGEVRLDLKNAQNPTSTSFDPSCDLLIAKPYDYEVADGQTEVVINDLCFARMMSVLKINLNSEYLSNETVKSVSFEAEGVQLTGAMRFNLAESSFKGNLSTTGKTKVTAEYSDDPISVAGEKNAVYFVVAPVTIPAGKTLTFTIETENYDISKVVTTPSEKTFLAGNVNVINLNIVEGDCVAKTEDTSDYSGTYAILAKRSTGAFWYMTNDLGTANTKRFTAEEASENLPEEGVTLGASKLWTVSKSDEGYKVKSVGADKYITYTSGNSANLDDEGILFTITKTNDGYYNLSYAASDETRYLSLNGTSGSDYFALYKDGQRKDLALIPAVQGEEPATLSATAPSQMPAEGGEGSFAYELKNPKDGISLTATTGADWITGVSVGDGEVTYTVTANEREEARQAVITLTYGDLTEDVTITQAGKPAEGGEIATWSWAGGSSSDFKDLDNVTTNGFGSDYAVGNAPYNIKLDGTGDYFVVKVDGAVQSVSVGVKMIGGADTSYLDIQGSTDGESFTTVQKLTISGSQNDIINLTTTNTFDASYRYVKFYFTKGSNVGVGPITITYIPDNNGSGSETPDEVPEIVVMTDNEQSIGAEGGDLEFEYTLKNLNASLAAEVVEGNEMVEDLSVGDGCVSVTVAENTSAQSRTAKIRLTCEAAAPVILTIVQDANVSVEPAEPTKVTVAEFVAAEDGDTVYELSGTISKINTAYNESYNNISFTLEDETGSVLIYRMSCEGLDDPMSLNVADEITVQGCKTTYNSASQMAQGGKYITHVDHDAPAVEIQKVSIADFKASTNSTTIYELTGAITSISTAYNSLYNNISFYFKDETGEVQVYRMSCDGVADPNSIKVGDQITIQGTRGEYNSTPQVAEGSKYISHISSATAPVITCVDNVVTITAESGATIYYTLNGADPTVSSTKYTAPFSINETVIVKAIALVNGKVQSAVAEGNCVYRAPGQDQVEPVSYTIMFGSNYNSGNISAYDKSWSVTYNGFKCNLANWNNNNSGWNYVKAGSKKFASVATITTASPIPEEMLSVTMKVDAITTDMINSIKLYVSTNSDFTGSETYNVTPKKGDLVFNITSPVKNAYYKIEVDCKQGSSNGLIQVSKVVFAN